MRIGLTSPVVTLVPGAHSAWETTASVDDLVRVAQAADRLGFDHLTCSEHVAVPAEIAAQRGGTYFDPLATLSYLAAGTERIRLATQVVVLGYHHPLALAKRYGTLDRLSGGRVVLGVGVGSLEEEFDLLGVPFEGRGALADDQLAALRTAFTQDQPAHHGPHIDFSGFVVEPRPVQSSVPLWVGGRTMRSLRRATTYADGWVPFGLSADELATMLTRVDLPDDFEVVLGPARPLDPTSDPERSARALVRLREAGATLATVRLAADSVDHYVEQLEAMHTLALGIE